MTRHTRLAGVRLLAALFLIHAAAADAQAPAPTAITAAERAELVDAIADRLLEEYVAPTKVPAIARALRANAARGDYAGIADGHALAERLTGDLRAVGKDGHLWVSYRPDGARDEPAAASRADLDASRAAAAADNFGFERVERLAGNVGYLRLRLFESPYLAAETATAAMRFVAHTDALIVDLRTNGGGDPDMVTYLLSYLFDARTHLNDIHFRHGDRLQQAWTLPHVPGPLFGGSKPVYVLIGKRTFSAAEDYSYALQSLKRATIVGEPSGGGAHPNRDFRLTAHFSAAIPYARSISPVTGANWEGTGVLPDVAVPAAQAFDAAYRRALRGLSAAATDAARKAELQRVLDGFDAAPATAPAATPPPATP